MAQLLGPAQNRIRGGQLYFIAFPPQHSNSAALPSDWKRILSVCNLQGLICRCVQIQAVGSQPRHFQPLQQFFYYASISACTRQVAIPGCQINLGNGFVLPILPQVLVISQLSIVPAVRMVGWASSSSRRSSTLSASKRMKPARSSERVSACLPMVHCLPMVLPPRKRPDCCWARAKNDPTPRRWIRRRRWHA